MKCSFFLNVVVGKSSTVFELLAGKNETLLIRRNPFFILNFCLDVINSIGW